MKMTRHPCYSLGYYAEITSIHVVGDNPRPRAKHGAEKANRADQTDHQRKFQGGNYLTY